MPHQVPQGKEIIPAQTTPAKELIRAKAKFQTLKTLEPVPPKLKRPPCLLWMSPYSIRLIDKHTALRRNPHHIRNMERGITISVSRSLMEYSRRRAEESAIEIGGCLEPSTAGADSAECSAF